jgi:hypothetical protein
MIDTSPTDGEQPQSLDVTPHIETPAAPAVEQTLEQPQNGDAPPAPTIEELTKDLDLSKLSDDDLSALESGDPARIAAVLKVPEPKPAAPEAPKGSEGDKDLARISLKAIKDPGKRVKLAEVMDKVRNGMELEDAIAEIFPGKTPAEVMNKQEAAPEAPTPVAAPSGRVADIQAQIAAAEAERQTAKAEYDYDTAEAKLLEIAELKGELAFAKREDQASQAESVTFEAQETESRSRALEQFGELMSDPESRFSEYLDDEILLAEAKHDIVLNSPDWPEQISQRVYAKFFGGSGAQPSPNARQATTPIPPAPVRPGVRFPGSPVGSNAAPAALTQEEIHAQYEAMSHEERVEFLKQVDIKQRENARR